MLAYIGLYMGAMLVLSNIGCSRRLAPSIKSDLVGARQRLLSFGVKIHDSSLSKSIYSSVTILRRLAYPQPCRRSSLLTPIATASL
jgi:hypothetical protein